tara:strand:+ start:161 stop:631 length:471 start_codon:yes stop_codon:yes gene_type:complete
MEKKINKKFLIYTLIFLSLILIAAYVLEYKFGHKPCKLCIYERIPYFLSILLIIKLLFFKSYEKIALLILSLLFIISSVLAFYHFGIEQGFFEESTVCVAADLSKEELLLQLKQNTISCKDVTFRIFGLSLATINTIFSIILSVIFVKLFIIYGKN